MRLELLGLFTEWRGLSVAEMASRMGRSVAYRAHMRLSKKELAELNRRLDAVQDFLQQSKKKAEPRRGDVFVSLTLALLPLRNREDAS